VVVVEHVLGGQFGFRQVDAAVLDTVADSQDHEAVADFLKEVVYEAVLDLHGVDPETEDALLTGAYDVVVDKTGGLKLLSSELCEAVLAVEDGSDED
jgi:hypothetical protein